MAATTRARRVERMASPRPLRFTVQDYYAMARAGILGADDRTELISGHILDMSPTGSRHAVCVRRLTALFYEHVHPQAEILVQDPISLGSRSEPQPDVALLKMGDYTRQHPGPADVLLVVEVSDATLSFDRRVKVPLYARHGIAEVWVVAPDEGKVYVHRTPTPDGYAAAHAVGKEGSLTIAALPGVEIAVGDVLG